MTPLSRPDRPLEKPQLIGAPPTAPEELVRKTVAWLRAGDASALRRYRLLNEVR